MTKPMADKWDERAAELLANRVKAPQYRTVRDADFPRQLIEDISAALREAKAEGVREERERCSVAIAGLCEEAWRLRDGHYKNGVHAGLNSAEIRVRLVEP